MPKGVAGIAQGYVELSKDTEDKTMKTKQTDKSSYDGVSGPAEYIAHGADEIRNSFGDSPKTVSLLLASSDLLDVLRSVFDDVHSGRAQVKDNATLLRIRQVIEKAEGTNG